MAQRGELETEGWEQARGQDDGRRMKAAMEHTIGADVSTTHKPRPPTPRPHGQCAGGPRRRGRVYAPFRYN